MTAYLQERVLSGYDHGWLLRFLRPRAVTGVETFDGDTYTRAVRIDRGLHVLTLERADAGFRARITPSTSRTTLQRIARTVTGADTDLAAFRAHVVDDSILGPLAAAHPGVRLVRFADPFEGIVRAVLGQQVSLAAAATTAARLVLLLGEPGPSWNGPALRAFPSALAVAKADGQLIRSVGLTRAKTAALRECARAIVDGTLDLARLARLPGADAQTALCERPGIGPWTAAYIRMRVLGDADAFPASDLGVLKALRRIVGRDRLSARDAESIAEPWRPWRALAAIHLWESLSALRNVPDARKLGPSGAR
ncbi:MAG: DNA-3-methyladenine glycosylase family protein [Longimicrobiales bacterium]